MNETTLRKKVIRQWVFIMVGIPIMAVLLNLLGFYYIARITAEETIGKSVKDTISRNIKEILSAKKVSRHE